MRLPGGLSDLHRFRTALIAALAALSFTVPLACASPPPARCPYYEVAGHCLSPWEYVTWLDFANKLADNDAARAGNVEAIKRVIRREWATDAEWAIGIVQRESRFVPTARNRSGSSGLFQLLLPLHNGLFYAAGCTPAQWSDSVCNVVAARKLYESAGRDPWRL